MVTLQHYQNRRQSFLKSIPSPVLLMAGGEQPRNYPDNTVPYRADSNFLYFFAHPEPGSAALFDPGSGTVSLFLPERSAAGALWHGEVPGFDTMKQEHGVDAVLPVEELAKHVQAAANGRSVQTMAVADPRATKAAATITGQQIDFFDADQIANRELIQVLGNMRVCKSAEELDQMRQTAAVTRDAHVAAMRHTRPGVTEQQLCGVVEGIFAGSGCVAAYNTILSVRGEVLHNHQHDNTIQDGDIVLMDGGAENQRGYCSDVTRCWPASKFSAEAAAIYDIVLRAEKASIDLVRPGTRYRDVHLTSCKVVAEGLLDMGLLKGNVDSLVESGAHALFFPHGVGHLIGLDVHDMEAFGDAIAYDQGRSRSEQFGLAYLRLDIDLKPGHVVTIEPGIYFVPAILRSQEFRDKFGDQVDFAKAETFLKMNGGRGFGGIRIEDDVACTEDGHEVLTRETPKERVEVEALVGTA